ncbi:hypothetical protein PoB_003204500 [Plakobranchus ocellatus]|uniref:Uncharacterized protein n=1 Tax=Plakobranchus ocellatus TaxID=259542 RepID=A0AAV4ADT9_9GAST|nr:hypothetical protein PoB_003204500 [Plakobranchus ocellatus]
MFIVWIKTNLNRWIELSDTKQTCEDPRDMFVGEQFVDAYLEDLVVNIRDKVLRDLVSVGKAVDLYLLARKRNPCDQPL